MPHPHPKRPAAHAFTLVEAAISTIIVGVMIAAALSVVGGSAQAAAREREWRRGQSLAVSLMAEILATSFSDPQGGSGFGIDSGETTDHRTTLDDVDDFNKYIDSPPTDADGVKIGWATQWSREVIVENVTISNPNKVDSDDAGTGLRRITITVTSPAGDIRTLTALKSRAAIVDAATPQVGVSHVTATRIKLRVGRSGSLLAGGATHFNAPVSTLSPAPVLIAPEEEKEVVVVEGK